jgi:hypothetical protein
MYIADNVENPFIFGKTRIQMLNRAKITLNLLPTWYDQAFAARFHVTAPNCSLLVSEPLLAHCTLYEAGKHYVSTPVDRLVETLCHYLVHEEERRQIAENAYQLATTEMTLNKSIRTILNHVEDARRIRQAHA